MRGSMWLLALGCGLMLSVSGCCGYSQCGGRYSGDMCSAGDCGPVRVHRPVRQVACGDECGTSCDSCESSCDDGCQRNFCFHPLRWLGRLVWAGTWCGPRCGDSCETCDSCGGACDGAPAGHYGYTTGRPGCKSCNRGGPSYEGEMSAAPDGEVIQEGVSREPTPAPPPKTSRRTSRSTPAYN